MRTVNYGMSKLLGAVLPAAFGMTLVAILVTTFKGWPLWAGIGCALGGAVLVFASSEIPLFKLCGDRAALRYDEHSLALATSWRRTRLAWPQVAEIAVGSYNFGKNPRNDVATLVIRAASTSRSSSSGGARACSIWVPADCTA